MTEERKEFEAWAVTHNFSIRLADDTSQYTYFAYETEQRWNVWQAARQSNHSEAVAKGWDMGKYSYSILFNAIAASLNIQGTGIGISVKAFEEEMVKQIGNYTSPPQTAGILKEAAKAIQSLKLKDNRVIHNFNDYNMGLDDAAAKILNLITQPESEGK